MAICAETTVRLRFSSEKHVFSILDALTPEADAPVTRRAKVKLQKQSLFLVLTVVADDTVALRATLNAYLRWINSAVNVMQIVEKGTNS